MADDDNTANDSSKTESDDASKTNGDDSTSNAASSTDSSKAEAGGKSDDSGSASGSGDDSSSSESGSDSGSESGSDGSDAGSASGTPPLSTALNPQIVQAVGTTNHAVLNGAIPGANGVAYQKVSQAAAYAVQDSTDYLRNIMSMASATTGVAMQQMLATKEVDPYSKIIEAATKAVGDAQTTFSKVGTSASSVVKDFDNLA
ncbi:hypothetical protein [Thalassospira australica]|uniref:hypothetical protein n=1 Tax=Thalassospira australica TaxID=1528106 RepID=UPI00068DA476|nr:hypothetical protein [Thalassospira australica]